METPMDTDFDTLAAWADGESVNRDAVVRALETAEGRDYVVDLMALRRMVMVTTPSAPSSEARVATPLQRRWYVLPAAAAAVLCVAAGYVAGMTTPRTTTQGPTVIPASIPATVAAPAPTHVIRFESGVDWRETTGGN